MTVLDGLMERVRGRGGRVVLAEGADERVIQAARRLADEDLARPVLVGSVDAIRTTATAAGASLDGIDLRDPAAEADIDRLAETVARNRERMSPQMAQRLVRRPLHYAGALVAAGEADAAVAGATSPTRRVIEAGLMTAGLKPGIASPSSFFLMLLGERALLFADCAVTIDPTPGELAAIAMASADSAARLLPERPRVAMLSFSTRGSAQHPHVDRVTTALEQVRRQAPELMIDGELQADSALSLHVASKKLNEPGAVAGRANVLVFPDLDAGNIGYKLVQYLADAQAIGPVLQGFARPISDLSRGATVDDIVANVALTLALAD